MAPADPKPTEQTDDEESLTGILCPNCAFSNEPDVDFCARCRAPLSTMATIDPLRSTLAEGFAYRNAVDGTSKPIVLVGIWLIFFPAMALAILKTVNDGNRSVFEVSWVVLSSLLSVAILYRTTASFLRKRREQRDAPVENGVEGPADGR